MLRPQSAQDEEDHFRTLRVGGAKTKGNISLAAHHLGMFKTLVIKKLLPYVKIKLTERQLLESLNLNDKAFKEHWASFERIIQNTRVSDGDFTPQFEALQRVYQEKGEVGVMHELKYGFYGHVAGVKFTAAEIKNQKALADLRYPTEWYPATRQVSRTIHLHVGPTNSGKTYHALKRLENATSGVYAGPLRLLANEVFTRMNAKGKQCALITGEERKYPNPENTTMVSCTVEMAPINAPLEVAVIDEIQMINSPDRGWAWTQAFLGIQAKEMHLCGEERTVPLIRELTAIMGDKLEIHRYQRLSPLKMMDKSLEGDLSKLQKGDCIVSFSVMGIHALREKIERQTKRKVAIIYGSLPPETRAQQAKLFNDPENDYDFLVASDAIGMGLNLSIKRIIFETCMKNNGQEIVPLQVSEIKQIAGRAGRYRTAEQSVKEGTRSVDFRTKTPTEISPSLGFDGVADIDDNAPMEEVLPDEQSTKNTTDDEEKPKEGSATASLTEQSNTTHATISSSAQSKSTEEGIVGYVTTLEKIDFNRVARAVNGEAEIIKTAGLFPPAQIIRRFATYFPPGTPFSYILLRLNEISRLHPRFHVCGLKDQLVIADTIQPVKGLSTYDRIIFCSSPAPMRDPETRKLVRTLAEFVGKQKNGGLLDIPGFDLELLDQDVMLDRNYLAKLESLHRGIVLYLWLSYHFSGVFTTRGMANHVKGLVEERIAAMLSKISYSENYYENLKKKRQKALIDNLMQEIIAEEDVENDEGEEKKLKNRERAIAVNGGGQPADILPAGVQEIQDILSDTRSFREDDRDLRDDYNEYNMPELELWESRRPRRGHKPRSSKFGPFDSIDEIDRMVTRIITNTETLRNKAFSLGTKMNLEGIGLNSGSAAEVMRQSI